MCDSINLFCPVDHRLSTDELESCNFPTKTLNDKVHASGDYRIEHGVSPLTVAGFTVTPVGYLLPGSNDKRYKCGPLAGYIVDVNVPACVIGHNRLLVNGVPFAAQAAFGLLRYWLLQNGCTAEGLNYIQFDDAIIVDLTPTFLIDYGSEAAARGGQYDYHKHAQAILNKTGKAIKLNKDGEPKHQVVFAHPAEPVSRDSMVTYTSYAKFRELMFSVYVKEPDQPNAFLLPVDDANIESEIVSKHAGILRFEPRLYAKWLMDNKLHKVSTWVNNPEAYRKVFNLFRQALRLDEQVRTKRLKVTTVDGLKLNDADKEYLRYHLGGGVVRNHADYVVMADLQRSKRYSALKKRISVATDGVDLNIPYSVQSRQLSSDLSEQLVFPGEYEPPEHLAPHLFSRISAPVALKTLKAIVADLLVSQAHQSANELTSAALIANETKKIRRSGISDAPLDENWDAQ